MCPNTAYRRMKMHLDKGELIGVVLMDLSQAFDCIPHDLLITNMDAYIGLT